MLKRLFTYQLLFVSVLTVVSSTNIHSDDLDKKIEELAKQIVQAVPRQRVAVLPFVELNSKQPTELSNRIYEELITTKTLRERFILVERRRINDILREQHFPSSDLIDPSTAVEVGRLVGARAVLIGTVAEQVGGGRIFCRLIDVETSVQLSEGKITVFQEEIRISREKPIYKKAWFLAIIGGAAAGGIAAAWGWGGGGDKASVTITVPPPDLP